MSESLREQVEQHLVDGGYLRNDDIERAHEQNVELFVPENRGRELEPKSRDNAAMRAWKQRMGSDEGP